MTEQPIKIRIVIKIVIRMCTLPNHNLNRNLNQKTVVPGMSISDKSLKKGELQASPPRGVPRKNDGVTLTR